MITPFLFFISCNRISEQNHYHNSLNLKIPITEEITEVVESCVTDEMNNSLLVEFKSEEVLAAIKQMHPQKPMPAIFFLYLYSW